MAAPSEKDIFSGIGVGEAQVFNTQAKGDIIKDAEIGIEQDRLRRNEIKKQQDVQGLSNFPKINTSGVLPYHTDVILSEYKKIQDDYINGYMDGSYKDINWNKEMNNRIAATVGFTEDSKKQNQLYSQLYQRNLVDKGKSFDPEYSKLFNENLSNADFYKELYKSGQTLADISAATDSLLQPKFQAIIPDWRKSDALKKIEAPFSENKYENPDTGQISYIKKFDYNTAKNKANSIYYELMSPEEQLSMQQQYGSNEDAINALVRFQENEFNKKQEITYNTPINKGNSGFSYGGGDTANFNGNTLTLEDKIKTPITSIKGEKGFLSKGNRIIYINTDDLAKNKLAPFYVDPTNKRNDEDEGVSGVPVGFTEINKGDNNKEGEYNIIVFKTDSKGDGEYVSVPYKGNETSLNQFGSNFNPDDAFKIFDNKDIKKEDNKVTVKKPPVPPSQLQSR